MRRGLLRKIERLDTYMHGRWHWAPRVICDLTELSQGVPANERHHWRKGHPNRLALTAFRLLTIGS